MTRHVMPADEVCRAWVWADRGHARTPADNLSFICHEQLMSYNTLIASRLETPKGDKVFFVTRYSYSVTTNRQLHYLEDALRRRSNHIIWVPHEVPYAPHHSNLVRTWKEMVAEAESIWKRSQRARSLKDAYIADGIWKIEQANTMVGIFNLEVPATKFESVSQTMKIYDAQLRLKRQI